MFRVSHRSKILESESFLADKCLDIIYLNEHWLISNEINFLKLDKYANCSFCRKSRMHGEVKILINSSLMWPVTLFNINDESVELHCEIVAVEYKQYQIVTVHHSPKGDFKLFLEKMNTALSKLNSKIISFLLATLT